MKDLQFYLKIIDMLRDDLTIYTMKDIAKKLNISKQNLYNHTQELKKQGILTKIGRAWRVDSKKLESFATNLTRTRIDSSDAGNNYKENTIRGHNFTFTLYSQKIPSIESRKHIWEKEGLESRPTKSGTWVGDTIGLGGYTIKITPNSIISTSTKEWSIYGTDAESIFLEALFRWQQAIQKLESLWNISLKTKTRNEEPAYKFKSSNSKHYALVNNLHAKQLNDDKRKLYVRSEDGVLYLLVDFSHKVNDFEVVGSPNGRNQEELSNFTRRFWNDAEKTRVTMQDVLDIQNNTSKSLQGLISNQVEYADNIKSHITAIQELGKSNTTISKAIKKLTGLVEQRQKKFSREQLTLKGYF